MEALNLKCDLCNKLFTTKGNLERHLLTAKHLARVRKAKHSEDDTDLTVLREEHRFEMEKMVMKHKIEVDFYKSSIDSYKAEVAYLKQQLAEITKLKK
jgi:hypothetical protein